MTTDLCVAPISLRGKLHFYFDFNHELVLGGWTCLIFGSPKDKTIQKHIKSVAGAPPAGSLLLFVSQSGLFFCML